MNKSPCRVCFDEIIPWSTLTSHIQPSPEIWFETEHFENLSFLGPRLMVPTITFGPRIRSRENVSWIIKMCKVYLTSILSDEQNP